MRSSKKSAASMGMMKTSREASRCKPRRMHARGFSGGPIPRAMKEKIWHNWLMEENYL
jgi:hypothetical protein